MLQTYLNFWKDHRSISGQQNPDGSQKYSREFIDSWARQNWPSECGPLPRCFR